MAQKSMYNLICRYLAREATDSDKKELDEWLDLSPENRQAFDQYKAIWKGAKAPEPEATLEFELFWERLCARLHLEEPERRYIQMWQTIREAPRSWYEGAVSDGPQSYYIFAVIGVILAFLVLFFVFREPSTDPLIVTSGPEERKTLNLPDGSRVLLDVNSQLVHSRRFTDYIRVVDVRGHAFFKVRADERPFFVQTECTSLRVLGTEFDVQARGDQTEVAVMSGVVSLEAKLVPNKPTVTVKPGQKALCKGSSVPLEPSAVDVTGYLAWVANIIVFKNDSLSVVADKLKELYQVDVRLENARLAAVPISGRFARKTFVQVLTAICDKNDLQYRVANGAYLLSLKQTVPSANNGRKN